MNNTTLLHQLCQAYGIVLHYEDAFGHTHHISTATQHSILSAMGVSIKNIDTIHALPTTYKKTEHQHLLPPVLTHRHSAGPCHIPLSIPSKANNTTIYWTLTLEGNPDDHSYPHEHPKTENKTHKNGVCYRHELILPANLDIGYHKLTVSINDITASMSLIIVPDLCYTPNAIANNKRVWGLTVQLYAVRSVHNWGIGDFTDLLMLIDLAAKIEASTIGVNPLHALYPATPEHASPYSPSSRRFLNVLYIDIEAIPEFSECTDAQSLVYHSDFQAHLQALRATPIVDYTGVHMVKHQVLTIIYTYFCEHHLKNNSKRARAFRHFQHKGGTALQQQGLFDTLQEHFYQQDPNLWGWPVWPEPFRYHKNPEVNKFAQTKSKRIEYFQYLQWLADTQLALVGQRAYELNLGIGLYQDIAVGTDIGGCEVWSQPELYGLEIKVGCPPDLFNRKGQDWGLPPWNPTTLRQIGYEPFIAMLRANMRHAGAIRLDHVMGLMRLFWVPVGALPTDGGYVLYPLEDLLGILALESQRHKCLVIGEDLGTVPKTLRNTLQQLNILSYRVMLLETTVDGSFISPEKYPQRAIATFSTHDLPTLRGFWTGRDLEIRTKLNLYPDEVTKQIMTTDRTQQRIHLLMVLQNNNLLKQDINPHSIILTELNDNISQAIQLFLSGSPSAILMVQAEDLCGSIEQVNMPGTVEQYLNWRHKLPINLEIWIEHPYIGSLFVALAWSRPISSIVPGTQYEE